VTPATPQEAASHAGGRRALDLSGRLFGAVELMVGAHAARARREASDDARRVIGGAALVAFAAALLVPVVLLFDVAVAVVLVEKFELDLAVALAVVALSNLVVGLGAFSRGRARLRAPVLKETRATLKQAALVLRG